ncbi:MAG: gluconate 2-dehydrogenase subunit 3 family protein [Bryobacteraceae bacterium]
MELDRRELFQVLGAGLAQQHQHTAPAGPDVAAYHPRALSAPQYKTLGALCDLLLPADADGPGAREAGVPYYLDVVLLYGNEAQRATWHKALDSAASDPAAAIAAWAKNELAPKTDADKFFIAFKQSAITAFYYSPVGKKSLGYTGDTAVPSFPGCPHPLHHQG